MSAPAITQTPLFDTCHCDEEELQVMRDLVARGVPQYDATLIAYGHPPRATASLEVHRYWIRLHVRRLGNVHRAELGMDPMPSTVDAVYPPPLGVRLTRAAHAVGRAFRVLGRGMEIAAKQMKTAFEHLEENKP